MSVSPLVVVHRDAQLLAQAAAARLITKVVDAQATRGAAALVLTGGSTGTAVLAALAAAPARDAIDWRRVDIWWGDERFLPHAHPERNETQARDVLLDHLALDPKRVHPMAPSDGIDGPDVEAAASRYAHELPRLPQRAAHDLATSRPSTCCCWVWGQMPTSPRCSPSTPPSTSRSARSSGCMVPPSRRRPGSR